MNQTKNYGLPLTGDAESNKSFKTWRTEINGTDPSSAINMADEVMKQIEDKADSKENLINDAGVKGTLSDADTLPLSDSSEASKTKKISYANFKITLKTYFDTLYNKYVLPSALPTAIGGVKSGSGITVDANGSVSVNDNSHNHTKSNISDFPASLPAAGGNANTVGGFTVGVSVPANAKFTDTTYSPATTAANGLMAATDKTKLDGIAVQANKTTIVNNLTTAAVGSALDAMQGKALNDNQAAHTADATKHLTSAERAAWNAKAATTVATASVNGLMAAADKSKLDGISAQANKTSIINNLTTIAVGSALDASQGKILKGQVDQCFQSVSSGKTLIASAITDKGVQTGSDAAFNVMAKNIKLIETRPVFPTEPMEEWKFTGHTSPVMALAVDTQRNVYSSSIDETVRKISPAGAQLWSFTGHTSSVYTVAVDNQGNVYSGSNDNIVRKISPTGVQIWSVPSHTDSVQAVAVDAQSNVYSGSYDKTLHKISSAGAQLWSFTGHTDAVRSVAIDIHGNVYSGSDDNTIRKISPTGVQIWSFIVYMCRVQAVAVDTQGNVYSGGDDNTVRKISSSGTEIWSYTGHAYPVYAVAVDNQGNVYSGSSDCTVHKISPAVSQIWSFTGHTSYVQTVAVDAQGKVYTGSPDCTVRKISQPPIALLAFPAEESYHQVYKTDVLLETGDKCWLDWRFAGNSEIIMSVAVDSIGNVVGGPANQSGNAIIYKVSSEGKEVWRFTRSHGESVRSIAIDFNDTIYISGQDGYICKLLSNGTLLWDKRVYSADLHSIAVDAYSNIYVAGTEKTVRKLSTDGIEIWSFGGFTHGTRAVAVDLQGNIYAGGSAIDFKVKKISSLGSEIWAYSGHTSTIMAIGTDRSGNVYSSSQDLTLHKISPLGNIIWKFTECNQLIRSIKIDYLNNVYFGSGNNNKISGKVIQKLSSSGTTIWRYDENTFVMSIAISSNGDVYYGLNNPNGGIYKLCQNKTTYNVAYYN